MTFRSDVQREPSAPRKLLALALMVAGVISLQWLPVLVAWWLDALPARPSWWLLLWLPWCVLIDWLAGERLFCRIAGIRTR